VGVTRGDPSVLAWYSDAMLARLSSTRREVAGYGTAMGRLLAAPSDLPLGVADRSGAIVADLDELERVDQHPGRFALALRGADQLARFPLLLDPRPRRSPDPIDPAARASAAGLIDELRDAVGDGWFPPGLLARLERAGADPVLALALVDGLGPDGLLAFPSGIDQRHQLLAMDARWDPARTPHAFLTDGERAIDALARALALATHHGLPVRVAGDLVDAATEERGHALGLSVLLGRGGTFDERFALRVADRLYRAERAAGRSPFWRPLAEDGQGRVPSLFGADHWFDPLTGAFLALAAHPLAAQDLLLAVDGTGDRLAYLAGGRTWHADRGAAFGGLIEAAATVHRDLDPGTGSPGYRSALVATRFLDALPYHEGGWRLLRDGDPGYRLYPGLVPAVGTVLATYAADVRETPHRRSPGGEVWTRPLDRLPAGAQAHGITLEPTRLRLLLEAVAHDEDAFASMVAAHQLLTRMELTEVATGIAPGTTRAEALDALVAPLRRNAEYAGMLLHAGNLVELEAGAAADARVRTIGRLAEQGVGLATPGGPITKAVLGQVTSAVTGDLATTSAHGQTARQHARAAVHLERALLTDLTYGVLLDAGWYAPGGPLADDRPVEVGFLADGRLVPVADLGPDARQAYDAWRAGSGNAALEADIDDALDLGIGRY
jgi:hypothetical protein